MSGILGRLIVVLAVAALMLIGVLVYPIDKGLDLEGGLEIHYEVRSNIPGRKIDVAEVIPIIRRRIDPGGLLNPVIEEMDGARIRVQIPGVEPEEQQAIAQRIAQLGKLELRLVEFDSGYESDLGMRSELEEAQRQGITRVGPRTIGGVDYWWDYLPEVRYEREPTYVFRPADFLQPEALARQIRHQGSLEIPSPARRLWTLLGDVTQGRDVVERVAGEASPGALHELATAMNEVLLRPDFYDEDDFAAITPGTELSGLLSRRSATLRSQDILKRNRLLMEAAFPQAISRSRQRVTVMGYHWVRGFEGMITGADMAHVRVGMESMEPVIQFSLTQLAAQRFGPFTTANRGKRLAVVLDDEIRQAPGIRSTIARDGIISGGFTRRDAEEAVEYIRQGSLPVTPEKVAEYYVGPTLGQDLIRRSWTAAWICMVAVALFMLIYYRLSGLIAITGLAFNLLIIMGVMALTGQTLWLAGIVGILLTIGMSVDANVLIFERMREEQERGRAFSLCVANGYGRAFSAITDANVTTLFTALALYMTDMPALKSFSFTLGVGIVGSMFCALFFTRIFFDWFVQKRLIARVKMMKIVGSTNFAFMRVAHTAIVASGIAILVGLYFFFLRAIDNPLDYAMRVLTIPSFDAAGAITVVGRLIGAGAVLYAGMWLVARIRHAAQDIQTGPETGATAGARSRWFPVGAIGAYVLASIVAFYIYDSTGQADAADDSQDAPAVSAYPSAGTDGFWSYRRGTYAQQTKESVLLNLNIDLRSGARLQLQLAREGEVTAEDVQRRLAEAGFEDAQVEARLLTRGDEPQARPAEYVVTVPPGRDAEAVAQAIRDAYAGQIDRWDVVTTTRDNVRQVHFGLRRMRMDIAEVRRRLIDAGLTDADVQSWSGDEVFAALDESPQFSIRTAQATDEAGLIDLQNQLVDTFRDVVDFALVPATFQARFDLERQRIAVTAAVDQVGPIERQLTRAEMEHGLRAMFGDRFKIDETAMPAGHESFSRFAFTLPQEAVDAEMLRRADGDQQVLSELMTERYGQAFRSPRAFSSTNFLGAAEAVRTVTRAAMAIIMSLFGIVAYVWLRFGNIRFGLAAIVALVHDVLITLGLVAVADMLSPTPIGRALFLGDVKIGLATVAAFLTLIGYSLNDTIVVFDRIRENIAGGRKLVPDIVNGSINQMLGRTILTSVTTFIVVFVQYIWGGPTIHSLTFVLLCGVIVGTYSSIFIASPILIWGALWRKGN